MADWTHAICDDCWRAGSPGREPFRMVDRAAETCCYCGRPTGSGIYLRDDPANTQCGGVHP